jgi:hypothetical protein
MATSLWFSNDPSLSLLTTAEGLVMSSSRDGIGQG